MVVCLKENGEIIYWQKLFSNSGLKKYCAHLYHAQDQTSCEGHKVLCMKMIV